MRSGLATEIALLKHRLSFLPNAKTLVQDLDSAEKSFLTNLENFKILELLED